MTRVIPLRLKAIIVVLSVLLNFYFIFSQKTLADNQRQAISSTEHAPRLIRKVIVNNRQITTQLFSPVIEIEPILPVVRLNGEEPYYKDEKRK